MRNRLLTLLAAACAAVAVAGDGDRPAQAASMTGYMVEGIVVHATARTISYLVAEQNSGTVPTVNGCTVIEVPSNAAATVYVSGLDQTPVASATAGSHSAPLAAGVSRPLPVPITKIQLISTTDVTVYVHLGNGC